MSEKLNSLFLIRRFIIILKKDTYHMTQKLQQFTPYLEKYLLSDDKQEYINSLKPDSKEKLLFDTLLQYDEVISDKVADNLNYINQWRQLGYTDSHINQIISIVHAHKINRILNEKKDLEGLMKKQIQHKGKQKFKDYKKPNPNTFFKEQTIKSDKKQTQKFQYPETVEQYLNKKLKQSQANITNFTDYGIINLTKEQINSLQAQWKAKLLLRTDILTYFDPDFIINLIVDVQPKLEKKRILHELNSNFYKYFTKAQNDKFMQIIPKTIQNQEFITFWFQQNFSERLDQFQKNSLLSVSEKQKKRDLLLEIRQRISRISSPFVNSLNQQTFMEILVLDLSLENPKKDLFVQFLQNARSPFNFMNANHTRVINQKRKRTKDSDNGNYWNSIHGYEMTTWSQNMIVEQYLLALFRKEDDIQTLVKEFTPFLDEIYLQKTQARVRLLKGEDVNNLHILLTQQQVKQIKQKQKVSILTKNKKFFKISEDVVLSTRVKNVKSIKIKVYELNLEHNYLQNQTKIKQDMDLTYLEPTSKFTYQFDNSNPYKQTIYDVPIKNIQKKPGIYIVQLSGQGISSRAIIRKGAITCLKKVTLAGIQLRFYDEDGNRIKDLSVWVNRRNSFVKQSFLIPFGTITKEINLIAVKDNFAQLIPITIEAQSYHWNIGYIYNSESFIVGNKAKIVLHTRLYLSNCPEQQSIPLNLLKNIKIKVQMINSQGIKSFLSFENVKFSNNLDYVLEFPIQSYTSTININASAQIQLYSGLKQYLTNNKQISINLNNGSDLFSKSYLKKQNDQYYYFLLGRNGQPIPNQLINFSLSTPLYQIQDVFRGTYTDNQGKINLGKLSYYETLTAHSQTSAGNTSCTWFLKNLGDICVSPNMYYKKGEIIDIPIPQGTQEKHIILERLTKSDYVSSIVTNLIKIQSSRIKIRGLQPGCYLLKNLKENKNIKIFILEGKQWETSNQIYVKNEENIYELNRNINQLIILGQANIQASQLSYLVKIPLSLPEQGLSDSLRAHILVSNFIDPQCTGFFECTSFMQDHEPIKKSFKLKECQFYNNKTLSDEQNYVDNRQQQKKFIGNNLQKPRIFLKRQLNRMTTQKQEELQNQGQYNPVPQDPFKSNVQSRNVNRKTQKNVCLSTLQSHNNFLQNATLNINNITGQILQFQIPKTYNSIRVYLVSHNSAIQKDYILNSTQKIKKKDLRHKGLVDKKQDQGWTMSRQSYKIFQGQSMKINRDSHWTTVSLSNIINFAATKGCQVPKWIQKWNTYSQEKKLQVYGEKFCHQINVFLRQNDPYFFNKIVVPFISNKIVKTFVDMCLLQDEKVMEYAQVQMLRKLNQFEKILLIKCLMKHGGADRAKQIASSMQALEKCNKITFEAYKKQFDTIINAKPAIQLNNIPISAIPTPPPFAHNINTSIPPPPPPFAHNINTSIPPPPPPPALFAPQQQQTFEFANYQSQQVSSVFMGGPPPPPPGMNLNYASNRSSAYSMPMQQVSNAGFGFGGNFKQAFNVPAQQMSNFSSNVYMAQPSSNNASNCLFGSVGSFGNKADGQISQRLKFRKGFQPVEKTKQYTQTTYTGAKQGFNNLNLVRQSPFWAQLATHLSNNVNKPFVTQSFIHLRTSMEFTLAMCFIPNDQHCDFDIKADDSNLLITAKSTFLIFVKQIKPTVYFKKFGVMINQRFFDPSDRYIYEDDGTQIQKQVSEFQMFKIYTSQTVITNTSGMNLELQILLDIPEGSIPLRNLDYTHITSCVLNPYSTTSFSRNFYFPEEGKFNFYPGNACRGKQIIAKGTQIGQLEVIKISLKKTNQSFNDVIKSGNQEQILEYISKKNIFDSKFFNPQSILWMLKDKSWYDKILALMKSRCYYSEEIWDFAYYHQDKFTILDLMNSKLKDDVSKNAKIQIYEYFPYYSTRTHKFMNEAKSTIRNVEFKSNYLKFLLAGVTQNLNTSSFKISLIYYLLLQDRIEEATKYYQKMTEQQRIAHKLQIDYLQCFLDMYSGYPDFSKARKISQLYIDYPIKAWKKLFSQVYQLLKQYDQTTFVEQQKKVQYATTIIQQGKIFKINIPPKTKVQILFYSINMEFYFSKFPFGQIKSMSAIKPKKTIIFQAGQYRQEQVKRPENISDVFVEVFEISEEKSPAKIKGWHWVNPELKVRLHEKKGTAQVFYETKKVPGCYCKVYSKSSNQQKFYRDGYTDITGTFKYVLADFQNITQFSILFMSEYGGITMKAKPPALDGEIIEI